MKQSIVNVVAVALLISFGSVRTADAQVGTTWVDPATGNVTLDMTGAGDVSGWGIFSAGGIFTGDAANIDPGVSFVNTDTNSEVSTGLISLNNGTNDLGNIIGAAYQGQSPSYYEGDITGKFFLNGVQGEFAMGVQVVPEPSSIVLAVFGLVSLALCGWRRRKA